MPLPLLNLRHEVAARGRRQPVAFFPAPQLAQKSRPDIAFMHQVDQLGQELQAATSASIQQADTGLDHAASHQATVCRCGRVTNSRAFTAGTPAPSTRSGSNRRCPQAYAEGRAASQDTPLMGMISWLARVSREATCAKRCQPPPRVPLARQAGQDAPQVVGLSVGSGGRSFAVGSHPGSDRSGYRDRR
jgi:hypothetical protein